jgi:hypothetical protein
MVDPQVQKADKPKAPGAAPETPGAAQTVAMGYAPKKRKKKYSRGLKGPQKLEVAVSKGLHRFARALEDGLGSWRENRSSSSRKRRDGAVRDALKNYGKAVTKFQKTAAKIPEDITKALPGLRGIFR